MSPPNQPTNFASSPLLVTSLHLLGLLYGSMFENSSSAKCVLMTGRWLLHLALYVYFLRFHNNDDEGRGRNLLSWYNGQAMANLARQICHRGCCHFWSCVLRLCVTNFLAPFTTIQIFGPLLHR